jgi:hypothetical protein
MEDSYQETLDLIKIYEETFPISLSDEEIQIAECGFMTVFGRDKFHRPVLIL